MRSQLEESVGIADDLSIPRSSAVVVPTLTDPISQPVRSGATVSLSFTAPGAMHRAWLEGSVFSSLTPLNTSLDGLSVGDDASLTINSFHPQHEGQYSGLAAYSNGQFLLTCPAQLSHASE